jgi:hypothetical protein
MFREGFKTYGDNWLYERVLPTYADSVIVGQEIHCHLRNSEVCCSVYRIPPLDLILLNPIRDLAFYLRSILPCVPYSTKFVCWFSWIKVLFSFIIWCMLHFPHILSLIWSLWKRKCMYIDLWVFNDAVNSWGYVGPNDRMINELERVVA